MTQLSRQSKVTEIKKKDTKRPKILFENAPIAQKKMFPANEQQPSRVFYPSKEAAPMNKLNSSEILVKHEISVQRLPRGQNLVSVTRPG